MTPMSARAPEGTQTANPSTVASRRAIFFKAQPR
jgi:hypothetical protein